MYRFIKKIIIIIKKLKKKKEKKKKTRVRYCELIKQGELFLPSPLVFSIYLDIEQVKWTSSRIGLNWGNLFQSGPINFEPFCWALLVLLAFYCFIFISLALNDKVGLKFLKLNPDLNFLINYKSTSIWRCNARTQKKKKLHF